MKINMGTIDKSLRLLMAVAIGILYFTNVISGMLAIVLLVIAAIFIITSSISFCPAYHLLGISSCRKIIQSQKK